MDRLSMAETDCIQSAFGEAVCAVILTLQLMQAGATPLPPRRCSIASMRPTLRCWARLSSMPRPGGAPSALGRVLPTSR